MAVSIGPFQNIVGVGWDSDGSGGGGGPAAIEAYFWFRFKLENFSKYPCRPAEDLSDGDVFGRNEFASQVRIIPDERFVALSDNGLYGFIAEGVQYDLDALTYSGIPAPPPPEPTTGQYDWSDDPSREYIVTTPADVVDPLYPAFDKSLIAEYQFWHRTWDGGEFCDWQVPLVGLPYDNKGYYKRIFTEATGEWLLDNSYVRSEFMDVSAFTVTWPATSKVYTAKALRTYSGTVYGGRVVVLLT
jgi:hypothetical protein